MNKYTVFLACIILHAQLSLSQNQNDSVDVWKHLEEVTVTADRATLLNKSQALEIVSADAAYLSVNRGNSLMSTLEKIPGVKSMQIGQGFSKPMIRGLGFNRVAVVQNGIKQQGQQWGADHGLEIDQYDVEKVDIYKGASSLQYGSDAIAGVIVIQPMSLKAKDGLSGTALINGASNNRLFGGSVNTHYQHEGKYIEARATYQNFEDYRVPAKSFQYLGWVFPIHNKVLKNTAGRETDLSLKMGIIKQNYSSNLLISNVYAKTGFFAGAHGIPTTIDLEDDGRYRNIGLPYQRVNHFKVAFNQMVKLDSKNELNFDLGYQNNNRKEFSLPHTHGSAELPDSNLELLLKLQTASLNTSWANQTSEKNRLTIGLSSEYQDNDIAGYSFLMPEFEQIVAGVYAIDRLRLSEKMVLTSGLRYDFGHLKIHEFIDPYLPDEYKMRAEKLNKNMGGISFSVGASYTLNPMWTMKANLGKSFRMVTANELSSNGVHHGTFRHEVGDPNLKTEQSYQLDYSVEFNKRFAGFVNQVRVNTSLFGNYFPNFIFLNPTGEFSWLPDAGQYYKYEQSKTLRAGGEVQMIVDFGSIFQWETAADYVYAKDLDSKYPIPFTPPFSMLNELSINLKKISVFSKSRIAFAHRFTTEQTRVTRNELSTPSSNIFDASLSLNLPVKTKEAKLIFQTQNIFDTKYYNHLSFYRYLDLPEIGRNFKLTMQMTF